jgi:TolA-binding protein
VETWAEALGVLELKIQRAAMSMGISPSDSLSGLAQARTGDPALGRPAMPAPAEPQQPPEILNPPAANPEDAAALAKRQRIQELEREIAELQRAAKLRKLEEIEREIALLKSRRRT